MDAGCFVGSIVGSVLRNLLHNPLLATKRICPTNGPLKGNHKWTIQRSVCKRTKDLFQLSNRPSETIWNFWRSQPHGPAVYQLSNHNPLQTNWSAKENCMQEPHSNFASKSLLSPKTPKVLLLLMKKSFGVCLSWIRCVLVCDQKIVKPIAESDPPRNPCILPNHSGKG